GSMSAAIIPRVGRGLARGQFAFRPGPKAIELRPATPNSELRDLKPRVLGQYEGEGLHLMFSPDGRRLFAMNRKLEAVNAAPPVGPGPVPPPSATRPTDRVQLTAYEVESGKKVAEFDTP